VDFVPKENEPNSVAAFEHDTVRMVDGGGGFAATGALTCAADAEATYQDEEGESEEFHGGCNSDAYFCDSRRIGYALKGCPKSAFQKSKNDNDVSGL
jgi:hypothetical protein